MKNTKSNETQQHSLKSILCPNRSTHQWVIPLLCIFTSFYLYRTLTFLANLECLFPHFTHLPRDIWYMTFSRVFSVFTEMDGYFCLLQHNRELKYDSSMKRTVCSTRHCLSCLILAQYLLHFAHITHWIPTC